MGAWALATPGTSATRARSRSAARDERLRATEPFESRAGRFGAPSYRGARQPLGVRAPGRASQMSVARDQTDERRQFRSHQQVHRVEVGPLRRPEPDMHVSDRCPRVTRSAGRQRRTRRDYCIAPHQDARYPRSGRLGSIGMCDRDVALAAHASRERDDTRCDRADLGTRPTRDVDPPMTRAERRSRRIEGPQHGTDDGPGPGPSGSSGTPRLKSHRDDEQYQR